MASDEEVFYAHSVDGASPTLWEPLECHLVAVAERAALLAGAFGAAELGRAAGLLHDAGKLRRAFQRYIRGQAPRAEHAICGALLARQHYRGAIGHILAYITAGHHGGLPNGRGDDRALDARLRAGASMLADMAPWPEYLNLPVAPHLPLRGGRDRLPFAAGFLTRMLFSALVDADFLETERFYAPDQSTVRDAIAAIPLIALEARLQRHLDELGATAARRATTDAEAAIVARRADVLTACLRAAENPPGVFSLSVPTGGGKTLSSLAFALRHALRHGLRRVIYVIPYTSIIEQTADTFRHALGPDLANAIIEHHSAASPISQDEDAMGPKRLRLAAENWDAPIVVTTSVQFFESLYANRSARCRKLHNIAGSVVVLDEVQALPLRLLAPCVATLRELAGNYRTSIVLCSATVPDLRRSPNLGAGFSDVREIVDDVPGLFAAFRRVRTEKAGALDDAALVARLVEEPQALCIVDARAHAAELHALVRACGPDGVFHLSAAMCPAHRRAVLAEAKARLAEGQPCRLIATQVVEAGVDIDFPVVYRAAAGIDSLAQAAGRCNRNGRRPEGRFVIFDSTRDLFLAELKRRRELARPLVAAADDPLALETVGRYFEFLLNVEKGNFDAPRILPRFEEAATQGVWPFRSIAQDFRLIDEDTVPVIVPWGDAGPVLVDELSACARQGRPVTIGTLRALQQVTVSLYRGQFARLDQAGAIGRMGPDGAFMALVREGFYDDAIGLTLGDVPRRPEDNIV